LIAKPRAENRLEGTNVTIDAKRGAAGSLNFAR